MNNYERFLAFEVVVNILDPEEYKAFIERCEDLRLDSIKYLKKISFEELHKSGGIWKHEIGDICIEYQPTRSFTFGPKKSYIDYGIEVISLTKFLEATK